MDAQGTLARSTRHRGAGQALVEFALVVPLLLVLLMGVIDFGAVFANWNELRSASREGARLAAVDNGCFATSPAKASCPSGSSAELTKLVSDTRARAVGLVRSTDMTVQVCYPTGATPGVSDVTVTVTYPASSITGMYTWLFGGMTLSSQAVMRLEQAPTFDRSAGCP